MNMQTIIPLLLSYLLALVRAGDRQGNHRQIPIALPNARPSQTKPQLPEYTGIGFDFASNYVTAAVSFPNGTNAIIATIPGTEEYNDLMHHLSLSSSKHLAPPYNNLDEWVRDYPRQKWRRFLRRLGLASCKEASILGSMLKPLKDKAEGQLGHPVTHALASFPSLTALYAEDVWDAFEYVGLVFQQFISWPVTVPDFAANYASQGYYLCKEYKNKTACEKEKEQLDSQPSGVWSTFNFHLSDTTLMLNLPILASPYSYILFEDSKFEDFSLGLRARDSEGEERYWKAVAIRIEMLLEQRKLQWEYTVMQKVFVTGKGIYEERFVEMVQKICEYKGLDVEFFMNEATTLTATGTAELGKRDLYLNPGKPHPSIA